MTKYYVDQSGCYIGAFDGVEPPDNSLEVPSAPSDVRQLWTASGWSEPKKTDEQLREEWKASRAASVEAIKVTTQAGNTFDGDETSQGRMARAILALNAAAPGAAVNWVLADNSVIDATAQEITEALALAGSAQAGVWVAG